MKYEWRKQEKDLYLPKSIPALIDVPAIQFFCLNGRGNPNSPAFQERIEALYALSYAIRMMPKKGITPEGYFEYTVFPLEGYWDMDAEGEPEKPLNKDKFIYTLMIRQPDFVTEDLMVLAKEAVQKKVSPQLLQKISLTEITEGLCVQCLHIGSYDDEPETFEKMKEFCGANGFIRKEPQHREIYLSDFRKTAAEKLKTVLRFKVAKA